MAEIGASVSVLGIELDGLVVVVDCGLHVAETKLVGAAVGVSRSKLRVELNGLIVVVYSGLQVSELALGDAPVVVCYSALGVEPDRKRAWCSDSSKPIRTVRGSIKTCSLWSSIVARKRSFKKGYLWS